MHDKSNQQYYTQIGPMCAWTIITEFNLQSATGVKNAVVFYYIQAILHTLAMSACSIVLSVFAMKSVLKFPYLNYLNSLTSQFSTFCPEETCALRATPSRASNLAAK